MEEGVALVPGGDDGMVMEGKGEVVELGAFFTESLLLLLADTASPLLPALGRVEEVGVWDMGGWVEQLGLGEEEEEEEGGEVVWREEMI